MKMTGSSGENSDTNFVEKYSDINFVVKQKKLIIKTIIKLTSDLATWARLFKTNDVVS